MRFRHLLLAGGLSLAIIGPACASVITQDTRYDGGSGPALAASFLSSFASLAAGTGTNYGVTTNIASWSGLRNQYGYYNDVATEMTAQFSVGAGQAGSWNFQTGGDGDFGGALFLDGALIGSNMSNFATDPAVTANSVTVSAGNHTLAWVTFDSCCDGGYDSGRFETPGAASFTTFAASDGLAAPTGVPEPASFAILMVGLLGMWGFQKVGFRA